MEEEAARKKIIAICRKIRSDWDSGHDWRWPGVAETNKDALVRIKLNPTWPDYSSLAATWYFLEKFLECLDEGLSTFERFTWDDALSSLDVATKNLEKHQPVKDSIVIQYLPTSSKGLSPLSFITRLFRRSPG